MLDVLHQRYMDLFQKPMSETMLKKVEESFVSKKVNSASLKLLKYLDTYFIIINFFRLKLNSNVYV